MERIDFLPFRGSDESATCEMMRPYVWRGHDGSFGVLVRAPLGRGGVDASTGSIRHGWNDGGPSFAIDHAPVLSTDPDPLDAKGGGNPTVIFHEGRTRALITRHEESGA